MREGKDTRHRRIVVQVQIYGMSTVQYGKSEAELGPERLLVM